jgi:prophage maintenance system killer protein
MPPKRRPRRPKTAYEDGTSDLAELAAKLAFGLVSNHAFLDGNKRTALLASLTFLRLNGKKFTASESEIAALLIDTANHELSEDELINSLVQATNRISSAYATLRVGRVGSLPFKSSTPGCVRGLAPPASFPWGAKLWLRFRPKNKAEPAMRRMAKFR